MDWHTLNIFHIRQKIFHDTGADLEGEGDDAGGHAPRPQHVVVRGQVVLPHQLLRLVQEVGRRVQELELVLPLEDLLGDNMRYALLSITYRRMSPACVVACFHSSVTSAASCAL